MPEAQRKGMVPKEDGEHQSRLRACQERQRQMPSMRTSLPWAARKVRVFTARRSSLNVGAVPVRVPACERRDGDRRRDQATTGRTHASG